MLPIFYHYSPNIEEGRTVNLILKANEYKLTAPFSEHPSFFEVPRNLSPIVPREWLLRGFVFHSKDSNDY